VASHAVVVGVVVGVPVVSVVVACKCSFYPENLESLRGEFLSRNVLLKAKVTFLHHF
jgi:hypothetical protein